MHHQVPVRELHGEADAFEELQPLVDGETLPIAERGQRLTVHVLHHHVRQLIVRGAAVEQARDVRVIEVGEDLTLDAEAAPTVRPIRTSAHNLDRDFLPVLVVHARREVYRPHAPVSQFAHHFVRAKTAADG